MRSSLHKKTLVVHDKHGTHRQAYYLADPKPEAPKIGEAKKVQPVERTQVHYGMFMSRSANRGIDDALTAIGKTHAVPETLAKVPIRVVSGAHGANGQYTIYPKERNGITLARFTAGPASVVAHEYGHFLDHKLFGNGKPSMTGLATDAWSKNPKGHELNSLMTAIYKSKAARELVKKHDEHVKDRDYLGQSRTEYLLMPAELFARSYAQWVGTRSSPKIRKEIQEFHERWMEGEHAYHAQWSDEDFAPIAREFDRLFAKRGLRRHT